MALDGVHLDAEPLGDFLVAQTVGNQRDDFSFTWRHPHCIGQVTFSLSKRMVDNMSKQGFCQQWGKDLFPLSYCTDRSEDIPYRRIYENKARRAGLHELDDVRL